jgi:hypothetical protein
MPQPLPALNLIAEPGRRRATLDAAREIERRGFAGISVSSSFGNMSQSVPLALATERIRFATAIAPIYAQTVVSGGAAHSGERPWSFGREQPLGREAFGGERPVNRRRFLDPRRRRCPAFLDLAKQPGSHGGGHALPRGIVKGETAGLQNDGA